MDIIVIEEKKTKDELGVEQVERIEHTFETHPCELMYSAAARHMKQRKMPAIPPGMTPVFNDYTRGTRLPNVVMGELKKGGILLFELTARFV